MISVTIDYDTGRRKGIIESDYLDNIREHFSVADKNQRFKKKYAVGYSMPTRIYSITPQGRFEPRMYQDIVTHLKALDLVVDVKITDNFKKIVEPPKLKSEIVKLKNLDTLGISLRDYQEESVITALEQGYGVIILPTSAGKTLVLATLVESIRRQTNGYKTFILVPDIQLVKQTYGDLLEYGIDEKDISCWTGGESPKTPIVIANAQILLSKTQDISWLSEIDVFVCDEAHKCRYGNKINKVISKIPAKYRFGLTGTLPESNTDKWCISGIFGPIIYTKTSLELRNNNQISKVVVSALKIHYDSKWTFKYPSALNPTEAYEEEITFLQTNEFRNNTIVKLVNKVDKNILIMVDRIPHGEQLLKILSENTTKKVYFVQGEVELEERESIRKLMETQDDIVCVAISKIFSTGINIKNLHYVIFAAIGKAKIKIIQSIGRSLRLHSSKQIAIIFDIVDMLRYGWDHYEERKTIYRVESIPVRETILTEAI